MTKEAFSDLLTIGIPLLAQNASILSGMIMTLCKFLQVFNTTPLITAILTLGATESSKHIFQVTMKKLE